MECELCMNKPPFNSEGFGICYAKDEDGIVKTTKLFRVKNTVFCHDEMQLHDYGQCPNFKLRKYGLSEFQLIMLEGAL